MHALAMALWHAGLLGHFERNPAEVERLASDLFELSTRQNFAIWLAVEKLFSRLGAQRLAVTRLKASRGSRTE